MSTGYVVRARGLRPVVDGELPLPAASGVYSTSRGVARYVAAVLNGGTGEHGSVLEPTTLASCSNRIPGPPARVSLTATAHLTRSVSHSCDDCSTIQIARSAATSQPARRLARTVRLVQRRSGPITNLDPSAHGAGAEVIVHDGQLLLKPLHPIPAMRRGMRLQPDDPNDPNLFQVDFSELGWVGRFRVVFSRGPEARAPVTRLQLDGLSFQKRPRCSQPETPCGRGTGSLRPDEISLVELRVPGRWPAVSTAP